MAPRSLEELQNEEQWKGIGSIFFLFYFNFLNINKQKPAKLACYSLQQSLSDSVIGHYTTPTFLATLKISSQISSSSTVTHVMYPVG